MAVVGVVATFTRFHRARLQEEKRRVLCYDNLSKWLELNIFQLILTFNMCCENGFEKSFKIDSISSIFLRQQFARACEK